MNEEMRATVTGWIGALFGEGISDDLMQFVAALQSCSRRRGLRETNVAILSCMIIRSTNPRTLLIVAPTILKQSLAACAAGVIDADSLNEGLSYFLQDNLLSFALPGMIVWLVQTIERTS